MRVRTHLSLLAAAVFLPLVLGSGIVIKQLLDAERHAVTRSMEELARGTMLAMDQELTAAIAAGRALSTSVRLAEHDYAGFYRQAQAASAGSPRQTAVLRADGQQLFNTLVPFGDPIPAPAPSSRVRVGDVLARDRPTVSNVFVGAASRRYVVSVELPVRLADGERVLLDQYLYARYLNSLLPRDVPALWQVTVYDREGAVLACNRDWDRRVAQRAQGALLDAVLSGRQRARFDGGDGVPVSGALVRSGLSGWTAMVAVPAASLEATAVRAVALTAATLLCALVLAFAGALLFARRLLGAIEYLGAATEGMAEGWLPPPADLRITELNSLQKVLHAASSRLIRAEAGRQQNLAEAQAARRQAEEQNRAKDEFLAMLGHELRNPLGAISSAIALVRMGTGGPAAERAHAIIARQSRHLSHLVDDLLDANRVLSGRVTLAKAELDLASAVRDALATLQTQGVTAEHQVELELEPVWVASDPVRLQQVIGNLVENAAKYTQPGGRIRIATRAQAGGQALLVVADNGKGIDADLLPRIWDVFVQGKVESRAKGGLGIGLAVVKSLVEQQGGAVAVASGGPGQGSTFTVRLPQAVRAEAAPLPEPGADGTALAGVRVLVVEDNPDLRDMMCALLQARGAMPAGAADGHSAIELARRQAPQLALVDIDLPDISGYEVARSLRAIDGIRLVAVTGYGQPDDVRRALDAGFERHLKKPLRIEELEQVLADADAVR